MDDAGNLLTIAIELLGQAEQSGDVRYADQVIVLLEGGRAAQRYPDQGATYWSLLGMAQHIRFERTGDYAALRESVSAFRNVAGGIAQGDPRWPSCASNLANALTDVFAATRAEAALTEAVSLLRAARAAMGHDDPNLPVCLLNLGRALIDLARARDDSTARQDAIAILREAVSISGSGADPALLSNLGNALAEHGTRSGAPALLAEAITLYGNAIARTSPGSPERYAYLTNLGNALTDQFEITGDHRALDRAIAAHRDALAALPAGAADTGRCLSNLAKTLVRRHEFTGDPDALTQAIAALREAVALTPPESGSRALHLLNLGAALSTKFSSFGTPDDLAEAVGALRDALASMPDDHMERPSVQSALGEALTRRFELTGDPALLDDALRLLRESLSSTEPGHSAFGLRLFNLAGALLRRFERVRHVATLDEAIQVARRAVEVTPGSHPSLAMRLSGLGSALTARYTHNGGKQDLTDAIAAHRDAVAASRESQPQRTMRLSGLGVVLLRAYLATGDHALLDEAATALQAAVDGAGDGDPNLAAFQSNLANALRQRFDLDGGDTDAGAAIELLRLAAQNTGPGHPNQGAYQFNLGAVHRSRFRRGGDLAEARKAATAFLAGATVHAAPPMIRATAAVSAGRVAAEAGLAQLADEGFSAAVGLLDRVAWHGLPPTDQEDLLRRFGGIGSDAAAWALERGDGERAVELLERGRGVLLAQAIDARAPHADLRDAAPALAERLTQLDAELGHMDVSLLGEDGVMAGMPASQAAAEHRMALAAERDALLEEIAASGMASLVTPARFDDLRQAARDGPVVVINVSQYRCDALSVTASGVRLTRLDTTAEEADRQAVAFVEAIDGASDQGDIRSDGDPADAVLEWLFDRIAEPVLRDLGLTSAQRPQDATRLWWCPTRLLSFLPLHAARARSAAARTSPPTVLDRVASSYTPTLRALLHAQIRPAAAAARAPRALIVSVPETLGHAVLPGAAREAARVRAQVPHAVVVSGPNATTRAVWDALGLADWVHLVCHGEQDLSAPSEGRLLMYNGALTVRRLARHHVQQGELAVLSACETVRGGVELADEAITLASATQLAGFCHVIGTLWAVGDAVAVQFVDALYRGLTLGGAGAAQSARSVHLALWQLRDRYASARAWAPFVHVGP